MARSCSTICLPSDQDSYPQLADDPRRSRARRDASFRDHPELFPEAFAHGYRLKDGRPSAKLGRRRRRIRLKATGASFTVRPSFALPYMVGTSDGVADAQSLRSFGVPVWATARVFGEGHDYWYRLEVSLGRNSVVGTTVRQADLPEHLLADERHQTRGGQQSYIATTVAEGCCLGAALAQSADAKDLQAAYGVFKEEAQDAEAGYEPETVSVDGRASTHLAWAGLLSLAVLLRCFLRGWLSIRSRGQLNEVFAELLAEVWSAYRAPDRRNFAQRVRRLREWAQRPPMSAWRLEQVEKMCSRAPEDGKAYAHPGGHRTSTMLDRVMRSMSRYSEDCQHLHGGKEARALHCRAWALLFNFRPWHPAAARANSGWRCPAERLNQHRYHDDWLQNLLVSASLGGYRR